MPTNASKLSDFGSGIGTQGSVLHLDNANQRTGIGTTNPQAMLQVGTGVSVYGNSGIVSATSFYGDGSNLSGITAGATLSAGSGSQRIVVTDRTTGTMTTAATDAELTYNSDTDTLSAINFSGALSGNATGLTGTPNLNVGIVTATSFEDSIGKLRSIPQNSKTSAYTLIASDAGKHISITTGGVTIPTATLSVGDAVGIYNNSGSNQIITEAVGVTLRLSGTASTGNRTLAQYGMCTVLCVGANTFVVSGSGLS